MHHNVNVVIGTKLPHDDVTHTFCQLMQTARHLFTQSRFDDAFTQFAIGLAITRQCNDCFDFAMRGVLLHNMASCLHHKRQFDKAIQYYTQARIVFACAMNEQLSNRHDDVLKARMRFVHGRMQHAKRRTQPPHTVLDSNGVVKQASM